MGGLVKIDHGPWNLASEPEKSEARITEKD
jgi:hypothetical protein